MHLPDAEARRFIGQYQPFLRFCVPPERSEAERHRDADEPLFVANDGRERYADQRTLLRDFLAQGGRMDDDIRSAVADMRIGRWVYLRDTAHYSVLLSADGQEGYAVAGLTQRLRDVVGGSGVVITAGVMRLGGHLVCDNLVLRHAWLGAGLRRSFQQQLQTLKRDGKFHR